MPILCGNTGVQMTGWFKRPIETVDDLKGLKMRIPGLAGRVYQALGVDVRLLPPGEIFPALERGVIDAAEFVGPFLDRQIGLHRAAKYYYTTGWHETATASELIVNKAAWKKLPPDLQAIVENACAACNVISEAWCQKNNAEAMEDLIKNQGVTAAPLPDADREGVARRQTTRSSPRRSPAIRSPRRCTTPTWPTWPSSTPGRPTAKPSITARSGPGRDVTVGRTTGRRNRRLHRFRRPHHRMVVVRAWLS